MEFLIFWLVTVIGSYVINCKIAFMMLKDLADAGFKINVDNMKKISDEFNENTSNNKLLFLIPIVNMFYSFKIVLDYNNSKWNILDRLRVLGILENMSIEEKKKYDENPTVINAILLSAIKEDTKAYKDLDEGFDELLKIISEKNDINYEELKEKVNAIDEDKNNSTRLEEIQGEKDSLKKYRDEIINSINSEEEVKILKKIPEQKKEK